MDYLTPWLEPAFAAAEWASQHLPGVVPALLLLPVLIALTTRQAPYVVAATGLSLLALLASAAGVTRPDWKMLGLVAGLGSWVVAILAFQARRTALQLRDLLEQAGALHAEAEGLRLHAERVALASLRPSSATGPETAATPLREREFPVSRLPNRPTG